MYLCADCVRGIQHHFSKVDQVHLPLNEVLEGLLDNEADLVLDSRDVGGICGPRTHGDLVVGETLAFAIAECTDIL